MNTTGDIHIYPINDKKEHILIGTDCPCKPTIEINGSELIIIHNSFDFREIAEELNINNELRKGK